MDAAELDRHLNWQPVYSNDRLLQGLMEEFIKMHRGPLKGMLSATFVAKRRELVANAGALTRTDLFDGDLVVFYVGLSDAAFQYSILFHELVRLRKMVRDRDYAAPKRFLDRVKLISAAQRRWNSESVIQLMPEDLLEPDKGDEGAATSIATTTDEFILGHELAHHYLGHTSQIDSVLLNLKTSGPSVFQQWDIFPESWKREFNADSAAIGIILGGTRNTVRKRFVNAALGAMLTMTILGQMDDDVDSGSDSHPPVRLREENIVATLRAVQEHPPDDFEAIVKDIRNFQRVLFREQGLGLGKPVSIPPPTG